MALISPSRLIAEIFHVTFAHSIENLAIYAYVQSRNWRTAWAGELNQMPISCSQWGL